MLSNASIARLLRNARTVARSSLLTSLVLRAARYETRNLLQRGARDLRVCYQVPRTSGFLFQPTLERSFALIGSKSSGVVTEGSELGQFDPRTLRCSGSSELVAMLQRLG